MNRKTKLTKLVLSFAMLGLMAGSAVAEELNGTLAKVKENGMIVVGHRESSVPFSYYGDNQKVIGYSQDYSDLIVDAVKKELNMPNLQVKYLPLTSQNRIPLLQNGSYDFECGSTTNNLSRQQQVDFSNTIFIVGTRFLVKTNSKIKDIDDLKGKNVVVTSGTTSEVMLNKINSEKGLNIRIIATKDHGDAFRTLESGRAAAFLIDDALLAGERSKAKKPELWEIVGTPLSYEAYGCMLRKQDPQFKALVDKTIAEFQTSGMAEKSYNRWFKEPIPPKGLNMNFDMSPEMKELFAHPNDKALD
ncbi:glutamate/aspartate ABC transporter substrate-binding protein [Gilliamella sp. Choc4-2]|jgi:glutamate/aspartate transport system substrate-binding protein|uniref:glutamate/aspartate ABC transporter substrate-binding protein n=1 Tax=unclassified Gilliamella TaxID=2685620 RepID=UPI0004DD11B8|nr:glutamate/aspartate ABC transporter substrate-binding protein [Gilliamella apicola]KFA59486.1 Glutamate Aspartate periplasmic binding protein precursor GltI [Gilliamella apicola]OCG31096.1 glutamate/aspartate ABC transporter substrate-binding protein [Gilliamella apicola]OCG46713.1 glutamate/aspartate ABC transporter substrate-binding protein [Gilliamella apicola]OCG56473.1 glutamate/aspartate ABC transporter substrate-binding protein [Gilliamella apicola]OCG62858.1 glutamate/aspartate ABC 